MAKTNAAVVRWHIMAPGFMPITATVYEKASSPGRSNQMDVSRILWKLSIRRAQIMLLHESPSTFLPNYL